DRAATLTHRLLASPGQHPLEPKPLDVNKFIAAEVEFLQRSLGEMIEVEAVGSAGVWPVEVDAHQLEAALLNLAVKCSRCHARRRQAHDRNEQCVSRPGLLQRQS